MISHLDQYMIYIRRKMCELRSFGVLNAYSVRHREILATICDRPNEYVQGILFAEKDSKLKSRYALKRVVMEQHKAWIDALIHRVCTTHRS